MERRTAERIISRGSPFFVFCKKFVKLCETVYYLIFYKNFVIIYTESERKRLSGINDTKE